MDYSSQIPAYPAESSVLVAAVQWLQGTLLGTIASTIAIVAVAAMGLMMLTGRVDWKRGATVIIGCFILFGASSIVAGLRAYALGGETPYIVPVAVSPSPLQAVPVQAPPGPYDPYAGAAVPSL